MNPSAEEVYTRLMVLKAVVVHGLAAPPLDCFESMSEKDRNEVDATCGKYSQDITAKMRETGLWACASPSEQAFLQSYGSNMDEYALMDAGWRMECVGMLMWSLTLLDQWPQLDAEMPVDLLEQVVPSPQRPPLRDAKEIQEKRDLIEFWHWRVRERQLIEEGHVLKPTAEMRARGMTSHDATVRVCAKTAFQRGDLPAIIDEDFVFLGKPFRDLATDEYQLATSIIMERHYALNWLCGMAPRNQWDKTPTDT